jgi:hypothetical protein
MVKVNTRTSSKKVSFLAFIFKVLSGQCLILIETGLQQFFNTGMGNTSQDSFGRLSMHQGITHIGKSPFTTTGLQSSGIASLPS